MPSWLEIGSRSCCEEQPGLWSPLVYPCFDAQGCSPNKGMYAVIYNIVVTRWRVIKQTSTRHEFEVPMVFLFEEDFSTTKFAEMKFENYAKIVFKPLICQSWCHQADTYSCFLLGEALAERDSHPSPATTSPASISCTYGQPLMQAASCKLHTSHTAMKLL